jgi:uncharacterized membrane protein
MNTESAPAPAWPLRCLQAAAALAGLYYGYDIGSRISGTGMGVVMALNAAVCAALLAAAVAWPVQRWHLRRRRPR